jgi:TonB-dependent starch-binding outer membrane protein SusC
MNPEKCGTRSASQIPRLAKDGRTLVLLLALIAAFAGAAAAQQAGQIRGRVTDQNGAPIADVQVYIVGQNLGSLSRQTGIYVIVGVPAGQYELKAERIGLTPVTRRVTVAAGTQLEENFQLTTAALGLDEIVVTGTAGAAAKREVGNAITTINTVDLPDRPTSVLNMLTASAPGLEINATGGGELGQGQEIRIRGTNSINNAGSPVIVIDGVRIMSNTFSSPGSASNNPSAFDQLNPNDIERIEVISGPAASTLYGTEASAGVIQVFTKKGTNRAPQWTAEVQEGTMWNQKFGAWGNTLWTNGIPSPITKAERGQSPDYMWMEPWICTGPFKCGQYHESPITQYYNVAVRGGGQALQYFTSGAYETDQGATPEEGLRRYNIRGNFTLNPMPDLLFTWNTAYTNTWQKNSPTGNVTGGLTLNVFRGDQNYLATADTAIINSTLLSRDIQQNIERLTSGITFTYTPLANLTNRMTIGYDLSLQERRSIVPFGNIQAPDGSISVAEYARRFLTFDYVGTYSFQVANEMRSSFSWGGQATGDFTAQLSSSGSGFPGAALPTISSASTATASETRSKTWNSGFFLQNVFDLRSKYFLTAGVRVDGNSTFGKNFNLQVYPKASASWVVSDESFFREGWGELKLRAAYGLAGRAPDAFVSQRTWTNSGLGGEPAFTPGNLGNPDIGPEVTAELELGFDASWFGDRVRPGYTHYHQTTKDAIQSVPTIPSLGFTSSVNFNIGEVENWGNELRLDVTALRMRNWGLDLSSSWSKNGNNVIKWAGESDPSTSTRIGRPISYSTWSMYQNPEALGSARRTDGTYQAQTCETSVITVVSPTRSDTTLVPRPGLDPSIMACSFSSVNVYGYPLSRPTVLLNQSATVRMPFGISVSARADYRGGEGYWKSTNAMGSAVSRNARSPVCLPYYQNLKDTSLRLDTPPIWVERCHPSLARAYNHPGGEFKLRSISATVPMDWVFSDRVQSSVLTIVMDEVWTHNNSLFGNYPAGVSERVPPPTRLRASLRVTF